MLTLAMVLLIAVAMPAMATEPITPTPFTATYAVSYRGISAGKLHFKLRSDEPGTFIYETRAAPSLLAKFLIGKKALERSVMRIDESGVRPLSWFVEDGKRGSKRDGSLQFGWDEERVSGVMEGSRVDMPTEPGLQDRLSIQIAVMTALLRSAEPGTIPIVDDDKIKYYNYIRAGSQRIKTGAGEFETVLYHSSRKSSSRLSRIWHAPALGYIAVRAERIRKGKVQSVMELVGVQRDAPPLSIKSPPAPVPGDEPDRLLPENSSE